MTQLRTKDEIAAIGTEPVPAYPYHDPEFLALEREAVFKKTWLLIGRAQEIAKPGDYMVRDVEIAKASLLVVRGKDEAIRAFYNVCTHRGSQLVAGGEGNAPAFSCPYHRWTFGLDGSLRGVTDKANFYGIDEHDCDLVRVHVGECAGFIFVCLSEPEQSLEEFLGEAGQTLRDFDLGGYEVFAELNNVIATNWKTAQDNFQEAYHVPVIHKNTVVPMATSPSNPLGYPWHEIYGPHRRFRLWRNFDFVPPFFSGVKPPPAEPDAVAPANAQVENSGDGLDVVALFPNATINNDFGRYFTHQFWPIDEGHSRLIGRIYMRKARTARERIVQEFMISATKDVWSEDWPVLLAVQKGLQSGAIKQIHFHAHEAPCRHALQGVFDRVEKYRSARDAREKRLEPAAG